MRWSAVLVVGLLCVSPANARINGPRLDSVSVGCGQLQDEADGLRAEYKNPRTSAARRDQILDRLRNIGRNWNDLCRSKFGDMAYRPWMSSLMDRKILNAIRGRR